VDLRERPQRKVGRWRAGKWLAPLKKKNVLLRIAYKKLERGRYQLDCCRIRRRDSRWKEKGKRVS